MNDNEIVRRRLVLARAFIDEYYALPLDLEQIAGQASFSRYHFLRLFREIVGMTPHQYVLRTRLHRAALRLRRTDEPVAAVAYDAGFNDLSTFNHRFRRVMGESPSAYRAKRGA